MLVTYFLGWPPTVCPAAASQDPSGDSRSAVTRGIATESARSWNLVTDSPRPACAPRLPGLRAHRRPDGRVGRLVDQDPAAGHPVAGVRVAEHRLRQPQAHPSYPLQP